MERLNLWAENGNGIVQTAGQNSSNNTLVQSSYPGCTVAVYINNTSNLATIYADNALTPLANPFTASNNGLAYFYAASGRYDVKFSGAGIPGNNFTIPDYVLGQIQSINNQTGENINLLVGTAGNNFAITANNNNITFNLPQANANNNGFLAASDWGNFNNKAPAYTFNAPLNNSAGVISLVTPLAITFGGTGANNATAAFDTLTPQNTVGDLIAFNNNNIAARLPVGANNLVLTADATNNTGLAWKAANVGNANGILPIVNGGTNGNNATQAFDNLSPITTKGDIIVGNNNNIAVRLGVGADGALLQANSANTSGVIWGPANLTNANSVVGILPITGGGTGANAKNAAFDALSPATTAGDLITRNSATGVRLPAGANTQVLTANSANASGLAWQNQAVVVTAYTVSFNNNAFTTSSNNAQFTLFVLGQFQKLNGVTVKPGNLFLNPANSITDVTFQLGTPGGNANFYTAAFSVGNNGAVGNGNFQDTALFKSANMGGATAVLATFLAANNNFGNGTATVLTGGNLTIWVSVTNLQ